MAVAGCEGGVVVVAMSDDWIDLVESWSGI
jgi:hypothetical protein